MASASHTAASRRLHAAETGPNVRSSNLQEDRLMATLMLVIMYVLLGGLFIGLAVPLVQGRIKPNPWYGFRVPKTLKDPDIWYAVNAYFGRRFAVVGLLISIAALLLCPLSLIPHMGIAAYVTACDGIMLVSLIWITIDTFRYLRRL
jgi:hypothetical protein